MRTMESGGSFHGPLGTAFPNPSRIILRGGRHRSLHQRATPSCFRKVSSIMMPRTDTSGTAEKSGKNSGEMARMTISPVPLPMIRLGASPPQSEDLPPCCRIRESLMTGMGISSPPVGQENRSRHLIPSPIHIAEINLSAYRHSSQPEVLRASQTTHSRTMTMEI